MRAVQPAFLKRLLRRRSDAFEETYDFDASHFVILMPQSLGGEP